MTTATPPNEASRTSAAPEPTLASLVGTLARAVERDLSPGDLAALRRLDPVDATTPAFWRACATYLQPAGAVPQSDPARSEVERRWAAILSSLAQMKGMHRGDASLGSALARAGYSDARFERLLRARDEALLRQARDAARFLSAKGQPANLADLARLVLSDGRTDEETTRRRTARDYYSTPTA
jgi:CRISPR system Cascade subunit CasB